MTDPTDDDLDDLDLDDEDDDDEESALPANPLEALGLGGAFGGGMPDLGSMVDGLAKVQQIQHAEYAGTAGGGLVRIVASGRMEVQSVTISPAALEPPDAELLADLVTAALRDLTNQIAAAQKEAMGPMGGLFEP